MSLKIIYTAQETILHKRLTYIACYNLRQGFSSEAEKSSLSTGISLMCAFEPSYP